MAIALERHFGGSICHLAMCRSPNVIFMIQVPRLYGAIRKTGILESFQDMLSNIFEPLFEVTLDPSSHPKLHVFLQRVGGFDMVDDESQRERPLAKSLHPPEEWMSSDDPPYGFALPSFFSSSFSVLFCFFPSCCRI